ncbi:RagB/SusD family nutrient uptake outer membrane protein [Flavivirga sp. 57AJ16]|uniref:RagB/SusD family nutrient uptake outer membrane protein n=1 Tax=Flavivirga sp. 57AJ16 TaxID=3025307 RepID=UPI002366CCB3|nr:RagB/SusD family nutrient uptake outer membrane protein [Flavivirga sp. 57AJ16]MDD7885413.1 RagB/SusD family nutrient uptake outer membrane protein [Flavivirga sp. 57AJ16]
MKNTYRKQHQWISIISFRMWKSLYVIMLISCLTSCDDFVDVDLPKSQLTSEAVFEDAATATAVLKSIYSKMRNSGLTFNLSQYMGLYADELDEYNSPISSPLYDHTLLASDVFVESWWNGTYNLIYEANGVIEGAQNSTALSQEDKNQLIGEALFIRAYMHFLLVELWGAIPYISTTNYIENSKVSRMAVSEVYNQIINDLIVASDLLGEDISAERVRPYDAVADALLARVYLYNGQWELAEEMASLAIDRFVWEPDLNKVFLKNSSGSIWQFKPELAGNNTKEGALFIFTASPGLSPVLSTSLLNAFETTRPGDQRRYNTNTNWVKSVTSGTNIWYHAFKYKEQTNTGSTSLEYSIIFRLAEQYLIRAEARAQLGDIPGAQTDLNVIRNRASLPNTTATTQNDLLEAILQERRVELFTEQGHRWFDLKRTGKAAEVLAPIKTGWKDTDILLPIPESEILKNQNLLPQNDGYN